MSPEERRASTSAAPRVRPPHLRGWPAESVSASAPVHKPSSPSASGSACLADDSSPSRASSTSLSRRLASLLALSRRFCWLALLLRIKEAERCLVFGLHGRVLGQYSFWIKLVGSKAGCLPLIVFWGCCLVSFPCFCFGLGLAHARWSLQPEHSWVAGPVKTLWAVRPG